MSQKFKILLHQCSKLNFLKFNNIWLFLPFLIVALYVPQACYGAIVFNGNTSKLVLSILVYGLFYYLIFTLFLIKFFKKNKTDFKKFYSIKLNQNLIQFSVYFIYSIIIIYVCVTVEKIALIEAVKGASSESLSFARESLFKSREGLESYLIYIYSILTTSLIPFFIALAYIQKQKYRHIILALFCASLMLTMEKALILKALMPLCLLSINGFILKKYFRILLISALLVMASSFILSKFGSVDAKEEIKDQINYFNILKNNLNKSIEENKKTVEKLNKNNSSNADRKDLNFYQKQLDFYQGSQLVQINEMMANIDDQLIYYANTEKNIDKYFVFGSGRVPYFLNRVLWIPYVTAYDWLAYFELRLNGEYLLGKGSSFISKITGQLNFKIEQEVFKFQYGGGAPATAAANTNFWIDAFVNFGWFGVIFYSFIVALITIYVILLSNPALLACFYYFVFQLSMGGLPGVLLSNGLIFLLIVAYFFPLKHQIIGP